MTNQKAYSERAEAKSLASSDRLNSTSAQALNRSAFFTPIVSGGLCGGSSERRLSYSVLSALHNPPPNYLTVMDGGSQTLYEDFTMSNHALNSSEFNVTTYSIIKPITTNGTTSHIALVCGLPTLCIAQNLLALAGNSGCYIGRYTEHYYHDQVAYQQRLAQLGRVH